MQALPLPRLPACWAGCRGPLPVRCGCGCASVGVQQCHLGSQRGGVAFYRCEPRPVSGAVPPSATCPPGRAVRVSWARRVRVWGPSIGSTPFTAVGGVWSGASPPPAARPLGCLSRPATHVLWERVCGCGGLVLSPWLARPVGAACRGGGWPFPGRIACHRCKGRLLSGAVPPPAAPPLGWAAGVPQPACPGCGWCGRGDPAPAPQRRCAPWGWQEGVPGGDAFCRCGGRLRSGAPPLPAAHLFGGL